MDIYVTIDKKDEKKFKTKANSIKNKLEEHSYKVKWIKKTKKQLLNLEGICIAFSNDASYIAELYKNNKLDIICITSRLESTYILAIINFVKDIYFLNMGYEEMLNRIEGLVKNKLDRKKCIKGEGYAHKKETYMHYTNYYN